MKWLIKIILFACIMFIMIQRAVAQDSTIAVAGGYTLFPGEITIPPGSTIYLSLQHVDKEGVPPKLPDIFSEWTIDGNSIDHQNTAEGRLKVNLKNEISYTAPHTVPPHNPVIISESFLASGNPSDNSTGKTKLILYCTIHILDEANFFYIAQSKGNGELFVMKEPLSDFQKKISEAASNFGGELSVSVSGSDTSLEKSMTMNLLIGGSNEGYYQWQLSPSITRIQVASASKSISYVSQDCIPHHKGSECKQTSLEGTTIITSFDKVNKQVRGFFYGRVHNDDQYVDVSGGFRAYASH